MRNGPGDCSPPRVLRPFPKWAGTRPPMPNLHQDRELGPKEVFAAVARSVYLVVAGETFEALGQGKGYLGSAIAVSKHWALTNCHVIGQNSVIALIGGEDEGLSVASVARADESGNRCFLKTEKVLNPIARIRRISDLAIGERVYTIGNPSGLTKTLAEGLVSGLRKQDGLNYVQTSAPISAGSSGGALVDSKGALVGVTTFLPKDAQNLNFAIAAEEYWRD